MKVVVTGGDGQLGAEFKKLAQRSELKYIILGKGQLDITADTFTKTLEQLKPDILINSAAYTAVDRAEDDFDSAYLINSTACENLVKACQQLDIPIIHFSTDYVYDNGLVGPMSEDDRCDPKGIYAKSKYEGENTIRKYPKHIILRTSWVYGCEGKNFFKTMISLKDRATLTIVDDQIGAPTYAMDLAHAVNEIIPMILNSQKKQNIFGTYNYSNEGAISWFDFANAIFELVGSSVQLERTTTKAYNAKAPRPLWSVMSKSKFKQNFGIEIPHWYDALTRCVKEYEILNSSSN